MVISGFFCIFAPQLINNDMKTIIPKRIYQKPAMQVFELKQQLQLLAGSGNGGLNSPSPFTPDDDDPLNS